MRVLWLTILLTLPCSAFAADDDKDIEKVNGSIEVAADQQAGDVSTVNGSIRIKSGATIEEAETVNGSIALGERGVAESLETVNGTIKMDAEARVTEDVETVNGSVTLGRNADVQRGVRTVNGDIHLDAAHVGGGIRTQEGDIHVEKNKGFSISLFKSTPRIVIGPGAVVQGDLKFDREVELFVSETATVGTITGAKAVRFSGPKPAD
jgi:hypothetical protein